MNINIGVVNVNKVIFYTNYTLIKNIFSKLPKLAY